MGLIVVGPTAGGFLPSGMTKSGTQEIPNSTLTAMTSWTADTANFPGSSVVSNALVVQRAIANATISIEWSVQNSGFSAVTVEVDFRVGGSSVVIGPLPSFSAAQFATATYTAAATGISLAEGSAVAVLARGVSGGGTRTLHSGWVRITQP